MPACGLWSRRYLLVAVILDDNGHSGAPLRFERSDTGRRALLAHLAVHHGKQCTLVATDALLRIDPIGELALRQGLTVWCAPHLMVESLRNVTGLAAGPPKRSALMMARLAHCLFFRPQLKHYSLPSDGRQLPLL